MNEGQNIQDEIFARAINIGMEDVVMRLSAVKQLLTLPNAEPFSAVLSADIVDAINEFSQKIETAYLKEMEASKESGWFGTDTF